MFRDKGENFKVELVDAIPGNEPIKIYYQGDWFDLCRGPHMTSTGKVGNAFKLMKVAGAYWRGDSNNPMLTRIYGTAFAKQEELDAYLKQLEEAERRDHRRLGRELDLFHFQEEGPGVVFWHAKGWTLFQAIIAYMRRRLDGDYDEVNAPQMLDKSLWETSGHWDWYRENMFAAQSAGDEAEDKRWFAIKPMNCPGHVQIFKHGLKSYRELPIRMAEFGVVHRYEPSGAMHGLMRVRGFTQDDAHIFCTEDQLADECLKINDLILSVYDDFGFTGDLVVKLSTRPEKRVGSDASWDHAEAVMSKVLETDRGARRQSHQDLDQSRRRRVLRPEVRICAARRDRPRLAMRHHAGRLQPAGAVRRLLHRRRRPEENAGDGASRDLRLAGALHRHSARALRRPPAPVAGAAAGRGRDHHVGCRRLCARGNRARQARGLRVSSDLRNEKINYKVREHSLAKVPALLVVGKKEAAERAVSIRRFGSEKQTVMPLDEALKMLAGEAVPPDLKRTRRLTPNRRGNAPAGRPVPKDRPAAPGSSRSSARDRCRTGS